MLKEYEIEARAMLNSSRTDLSSPGIRNKKPAKKKRANIDITNHKRASPSQLVPIDFIMDDDDSD